MNILNIFTRYISGNTTGRRQIIYIQLQRRRWWCTHGQQSHSAHSLYDAFSRQGLDPVKLTCNYTSMSAGYSRLKLTASDFDRLQPVRVAGPAATQNSPFLHQRWPNCTYPQRDGQAEWIWVTLKIPWW